MSIERSSSFLTREQLADKEVVVVGCGAIGSACALALVRMGISNFTLIDNGEVEDINVGPQFFSASQIGEDKSAALENAMVEYAVDSDQWRGINSVHADAIAAIKKVKMSANTCILLALDSLNLRKRVMRAMAKKKPALVVDVRMGLQELWVDVMASSERRSSYHKRTSSDNAALPEPCTERTISYTPMLAAGVVGRLVAAWCRGETLPLEIHHDLKTYYQWVVWETGIRYQGDTDGQSSQEAQETGTARVSQTEAGNATASATA